MRFVTKQGDTHRAMKCTLIKANGQPLDLTNCKVEVTITNGIRREVLRQADGVVWVVFSAHEVEEPGLFRAEFVVTYPDNNQQTFPDNGYIDVYIQGRL